jgi:hypothetical protein
MPLPKPKPGESLEDFLEYCPFDTQVMLEFEDAEQRFVVCQSLYQDSKEQKAQRLTTQKINRQEFIKAWDRQTKIAEGREFKKWFSYFKRENFKGVDLFLQSGQITGFDGLFLDRDITELYENLFASVGTQIALWYQDNFEKYIQKNQPAVNWRETFGAFGRRFAADKVTLVSGNRKKELQAVLKRLMSDPDFQALNERQAQRIFRSQFTGYSRTQAMRLVRTESITAANYAATQTANDLFGSEGYEKEWLTALDGRERPAHREADGQRVGADQPFVVGGEYLKFPGDPSASAKNRINCRCTVLTMPLGAVEEIENNVTGGLVSDIGFGVEGSERISVGAEIAEIIGQNYATREVIEEATETLRDIKIKEYIAKNKPDNWDEIDEWAYKTSAAKGELKEEILEFVDGDNLRMMEVSLEKGRGSYHSSFNKKIHFDINERWKERYTTVYHEIGHHIHHWTRMFNAKDVMSPYNIMQDEWQGFYKNMRKRLGVGARGKNKLDIENELNVLFPSDSTFDSQIRRAELYGRKEEWKKYFAKEIEELGENVVYEQLNDVADFIGAATKEKFGWGHGTSYYTKRGQLGQMAEMFAHMSEWRFGDATVIKKLFPDIYEEAMKFMDELIEEIRKTRGY